jgi:hypothetical protein
MEEKKKKKKSSGSSGSSSHKRRTTAFEAEVSTKEMLQVLIKINKSVGMQHHDPALPSHKKKTTPNQRQRGKALLPGETSRSSSSPPRSALSSSSHFPSSPSSPSSSTPKSILVKDQIEARNVKKAVDLLDGSTRDNKPLKEENAIALLKKKDDGPNDVSFSSSAPPRPPPSPPLESMTSFGRYRAWHPQESVVKSTPIYGIPGAEELERMYQLPKRRLRPREDGIGGATLWQPSESVPPIGIEGAIANNLGLLRPSDVSVAYPDFGGWRDVLRDPANVLTDQIKSKLKRSARYLLDTK